MNFHWATYLINTYQVSLCIQAMASWSMLPYEIRHHILSYFTRIIIEDIHYFDKHRYDVDEAARGYSEEYGTFESYMAARLVNRDFLQILSTVELESDGKSPHVWLKKKIFQTAVKVYTSTDGWKVFIRPGTKMWEACEERWNEKKRIRKEKRRRRY